MKVFIVFLSLLILNINLLVFQNDFTDYTRLSESVKSMADNCAFGSSMYFDLDAYGDGHFKFNEKEALIYVEHLLADSADKYNVLGVNKIDYRAGFFDDSGEFRIYKGGELEREGEFQYPYEYTDDSGYTRIIDEPVVVIELSADTRDMFRQSFLQSERIIRSSSYGNTGS